MLRSGDGYRPLLSLLLEERDKLNRAIDALAGTVRLNAAKNPTAAKKRGGMSPAKREALSEKMKAYWATKRKAKP